MSRRCFELPANESVETLHSSAANAIISAALLQHLKNQARSINELD